MQPVRLTVSQVPPLLQLAIFITFGTAETEKSNPHFFPVIEKLQEVKSFISFWITGRSEGVVKSHGLRMLSRSVSLESQSELNV